VFSISEHGVTSAHTLWVSNEYDFDLSLCRITTYFWRWNNRKSALRRISLSNWHLKLALE
jgi:hypothetical protein